MTEETVKISRLNPMVHSSDFNKEAYIEADVELLSSFKDLKCASHSIKELTISMTDFSQIISRKQDLSDFDKDDLFYFGLIESSMLSQNIYHHVMFDSSPSLVIRCLPPLICLSIQISLISYLAYAYERLEGDFSFGQFVIGVLLSVIYSMALHDLPIRWKMYSRLQSDEGRLVGAMDFWSNSILVILIIIWLPFFLAWTPYLDLAFNAIAIFVITDLDELFSPRYSICYFRRTLSKSYPLACTIPTCTIFCVTLVSLILNTA